MTGVNGAIETSEVMLSSVRASATTFRLDAEYFQTQHLADEQFARSHQTGFRSFAERGIVVDASAFYPAIVAFYGSGSLPFLRVADVTGVVDYEDSERIPEELVELHDRSLKTAEPGDILLTKGGSVARAGLVTQRAAASRDLIILRTGALPEDECIFTYLYLQTAFFQRVLIRSSSQTAQPHLTTTLVKDLPTFMPDAELRTMLAAIVTKAFALRDESLRLLDESRALVLQRAGLQGWRPREDLTFEASSTAVFADDRLDAEHFHPCHAELDQKLRELGNSLRLGDLLSKCDRGRQPVYGDGGPQVVNSKHVRSGHVVVDERNRTSVPIATNSGQAATLIRTGDILMNGTGVGTIGRCSAYLGSDDLVPDNHVTVLRLKKGVTIDPSFLAAQINSVLGQLQVVERLRGSSGQIELYPDDIREFAVWAPEEAVQKSVSTLVLRAAEMDDVASRLLAAAVTATELALEDSEAAATMTAQRALSEAPGV
jgi:type I restriction enzyme S subunit